MKTEILLDHEPAPTGNGHIVRALLRITGDVPARERHVPLNLSVVLDRSGSMSGEKLKEAKEAAALLVQRLWPDDMVSVVAYDDRVETVAEPGKGGEQNDLSERIRRIDARGSTNLSGGWLRARELVASGHQAGAANRVVLLTDGLANVGITDHDQLIGLCGNALEHGITTTTIGFGEDFDEVLLRRMAEAGGGGTYYVERPDQAPAIFADEIEGLLSLSAQNVSVELRPAAAARLILVHHRYPNHQFEGGVRVDLGDLYAREPRMVLTELFVAADDLTAEVDIAAFRVTADVVTAKGSVERREIDLPIRASLAGGPKVEPEVRRELLLQEAARARDDAREARETGEFERASRRLREASLRLESLAGADDDLREEAEDLRQMAERFQGGEINEADEKYLYLRSYANATSRRARAQRISRVRQEE